MFGDGEVVWELSGVLVSGREEDASGTKLREFGRDSGWTGGCSWL